MAMAMFEKEAKEIMAEAGVAINDKSDFLLPQIANIMNNKMAYLSVTYGLKEPRFTLYREQHDALVQDLKDLLAQGTVDPIDPAGEVQ